MLSHTSSFLSGAKLSVTNGDNGSLAAGLILICWNGHWIDIVQSIYKNRIKLILFKHRKLEQLLTTQKILLV